MLPCASGGFPFAAIGTTQQALTKKANVRIPILVVGFFSFLVLRLFIFRLLSLIVRVYHHEMLVLQFNSSLPLILFPLYLSSQDKLAANKIKNAAEVKECKNKLARGTYVSILHKHWGVLEVSRSWFESEATGPSAVRSLPPHSLTHTHNATHSNAHADLKAEEDKTAALIAQYTAAHSTYGMGWDGMGFERKIDFVGGTARPGSDNPAILPSCPVMHACTHADAALKQLNDKHSAAGTCVRVRGLPRDKPPP